jgi:hypothetical protein
MANRIDCRLDLPFFKQGDDVNSFLRQGLNPAEALEAYASTLRGAAEQLDAVSRQIKD